MNNIVLLLLIQICLLVLLPMLRRIIKLRFDDNDKSKRISFGIFSFINIAFPLSILGIFLNSYFREVSDKIVSTFILFYTNKYSIEIGFRISIVQILIYFTLSVLTSIVCNYFGSSKTSKSKIVDKFSIFSLVLFLFIFSPNFFQLLLFMFVVDILFLDFLSTSSVEESTEKKTFIQSFLSIITGNLLILISSALLIRRANSFDFNTVSKAIQYHLFIYKPYFQILLVILLLGIFAKISLIPFHTWIKNNSESRDQRILLIFFVYVPISLLILLGTPFLLLLPVIQNFIMWYGICIAVTTAFFAIFLRRKLESILLLFISSIGLILYSLGIGYYSVGFHLVLVSPLLFSNLAIFKLTKKGYEEEVIVSFEKKKKAKRIFLLIFVILSIITLIGVVPLNSIILSLTFPVTLSNLAIEIILLIFGIVSLIFVFVSILDLLFTNWIKDSSIEINKGVITSTSVLTTIILLVSILFPYFAVITPISHSIDLQPNSFILTALPLGICYLIVIVVYILTKKYSSLFYQRLLTFSEKMSSILHKIYSFEFIFTPMIYVTKKVIVPSSVWFYEKVLLWFILGVVIRNSIQFLKFCFLKIRIFILDYLIPWTKELFTKISHFSRKFEDASQRTQFQIAFSFLLILLLIVVVLFVGGKI